LQESRRYDDPANPAGHAQLHHAQGHDQFEKSFDTIKKLPTLEQRRRRSIELGDVKMKARDESTNLHPEHIQLRG